MKATHFVALLAAVMINAAASLAWDHYTQRLAAHSQRHGVTELVASR